MAHPELVIFDFDGTLVDTAPDLVRATNLFLASQGLGVLPEHEIRAEIGMGLMGLIKKHVPKEDMTTEKLKRIEEQFLAVYQDEFLISPRLFEGAWEFLQGWPAKIAIVSNKRMRFIQPILEQLQLTQLEWSAVIGGDSTSNMKPHPAPFLAAMDAAGARPEETVIVGDGTPDILGAVAVGSRAIAVEFGYHNVDDLMNLGAWAKIESFHDLAPLLRSII